MKVLLVADLHYTLRQWDWLGSVADRFDLVVVAGDLLDIASIVPLEAQIVVVRKYLHRLAAKGPLLVCSGNHDVLAPDGEGEKKALWLQDDRGPQLHVDGDCFETADLFFSILPWWDGPETQEAVSRQLAAQSSQVNGKRWVWVYHPPPGGTRVAWSGRRDFGDTMLGQWIREYRPAMALGGHIHNAPFVKNGSWVDCHEGCFVFNGGCQPGAVPTFTLIDTEANEATWIAAGDGERAMLAEPLMTTELDG